MTIDRAALKQAQFWKKPHAAVKWSWLGNLGAIKRVGKPETLRQVGFLEITTTLKLVYTIFILNNYWTITRSHILIHILFMQMKNRLLNMV